MERRVYIPVFGSGLGHSTRMSLVARQLTKDGISVKFSSFHDGLSYLTSHGFDCEKVPSIDVGWSVFSTRQALAKLPSSLLAFGKQVLHELALIGRFRPHLVLSDSRLSPVIAASLLGIPSLTVLNQLRILLPRPTRIPLPWLLEDAVAEVLVTLWSLSERILVPDLPPPYTLSKRHFSRIRSRAKISFTGFLFNRPSFERQILDEVRTSLELDKEKPLILALLSGPRPTRKSVVHEVIEAAQKYASKYQFVVSMGIEGGNPNPQRANWGILFEWCPLRDELLALADIVIARAGHSVIAQSIMFGKPMILIPIPSHSEQLANAARAAELGIASNLTESSIVSELGRQAQYLLSDKTVRVRVDELMRTAERFAGIEFLTREVISLL